MSKEEMLAKIYYVINSIASQAKISVRKTQGKKVTIDCEGDRPDARRALQEAFQKEGIQNKEDIVKGSSELGTHLPDGFQIIYKKKPGTGGMGDTTLNAAITELFPCIAFLTNIDENDPGAFYQEVVKNNTPKLSCYLSGDYESGKKFIDQAVSSTKFMEKTKNAISIYEWIEFQDKGKSIKNLVWGYRNKPTGVPKNHPGDIFIEFDDGRWIGVSLKAGGESTQEPKLNTYVATILKDTNEQSLYDKWKKESYEKFYTSIPNIPSFDLYGKPAMVKVLADFERKNPTLYNKIYDLHLEWLRKKLIDFLNENEPRTKKWLLNKIVGDDSKLGDVPLIVLKAYGNKVEELKDDDVVGSCLGRVKPNGGIKISLPISGQSKQNFNLSLSCKAKTTNLDFAIRTNKPGAEHKLGQFINLAVKFNGVK